jgi:hypothetical protein
MPDIPMHEIKACRSVSASRRGLMMVGAREQPSLPSAEGQGTRLILLREMF